MQVKYAIHAHQALFPSISPPMLVNVKSQSIQNLEEK